MAPLFQLAAEVPPVRAAKVPTLPVLVALALLLRAAQEQQKLSDATSQLPQVLSMRVVEVAVRPQPVRKQAAVVAAVTTAVEAGLRTAQEQVQLRMAVVAAVRVTSTRRAAQLATPKPQRWVAKRSLFHSLVVEAVISMWQVLRLAVAAT